MKTSELRDTGTVDGSALHETNHPCIFVDVASGDLIVELGNNTWCTVSGQAKKGRALAIADLIGATNYKGKKERWT